MERIVRNGISITIEISHPLYAVGVITLTGPHKQWRFTIDSEKHDASGRLENLNLRMRHVGMTGETTALAEVGMEQWENMQSKRRLLSGMSLEQKTAVSKNGIEKMEDKF